ncbi:18398_t:CDS:2, partial [Gigaspora margarita]
MFLSGLRRKTPTFVAVSEPENLEEAIIGAIGIEEELRTLTKKIEQSVLNYAALNDKRPREFHGKNRGKNEKGQDKQKVLKKESEEKSKASHYVEVNALKKIVQGKPESRWKNRLRGRKNLGLQPGVNGEETPYEMKDVTPIKKSRRKCELFMINKLCPYNVAKDIMNALANITIRQILQYANQRGLLARALRRPLPLMQEATYIR